MKAVNQLRLHGNPAASIAAGQYLSAFNRRRNLLAETTAKTDGLARLEGAIRRARRVVVFTQTVRAAELAAAELVDLGIEAEVVHGVIDASERRATLARFTRGAVRTIVAPQGRRGLSSSKNLPKSAVTK